jgi:hypothetical protein
MSKLEKRRRTRLSAEPPFDWVRLLEHHRLEAKDPRRCIADLSALEAAEQQEHDDDDQHQPHSPGRGIPPIPAMGPPRHQEVPLPKPRSALFRAFFFSLILIRSQYERRAAQHALLFAFNDRPPIFLSFRLALSHHTDMGEGMKQSKNAEQPQNHSNNHDCMQDGLNRSLHWYQVDQPKQDTGYDQRSRSMSLSACLRGQTLRPVPGRCGKISVFDRKI